MSLFSRLRALIAALALLAAAPAAAEPAMWVVRDADSTIYLFGSVHVLKPGSDWHTGKVAKAMAESQDLTLELTSGDDASKVGPVVKALGYDAKRPLYPLLSAKDRTRLAAAASALNLPPASLSTMRPWLAAVTLSIVPVMKAGYDSSSGVEQALSGEARALGRPIGGFETPEQQLRFLADLPEPVQVQFLSSTLDEIDDAATQLDTMVAAWLAGDLATLEHEFVDSMKEYPAIYDAIVVRRNRAWADAIKTKLAGSGVSFIAVGAGHLVGPDSVQAELQKRGVQTVRLN